MGVIERVVQLGIDRNTLLFISRRGAFLQPCVKLIGQLVELAGRAVKYAVGDADGGRGGLLLEVIEVVVAAVIGHIIGNEEDFETMLGIKAENTDENYSKIDPMCYKKVAEKVMEKYPNVQVVGNSLREVTSACLNNWQCVMMTRNGYYVSRKYMNIEIYDRVGGGDSFASGLIWCLLEGKPEQECIDFAAAYSALCHTIRNDWNLVTTEEAYDVMNGGSARVKR